MTENKPIWTFYGDIAVQLEYAIPYLNNAQEIIIRERLEFTGAQMECILKQLKDLKRIASEINERKMKP